MNSKECEEQLKSLIEHFKNGGLDFNATDIKAIEHLLLENKIQQDTIKEQKQKNKELHNKIDKVIELNNQIIKDTKSFYRPTSDTIYSGDCLMDIAGQNLKILKGSDVDE